MAKKKWVHLKECGCGKMRIFVRVNSDLITEKLGRSLSSA